jgi:hypothetical protein
VCFDRESNTGGPQDLQSCALPTELSKHQISTPSVGAQPYSNHDHTIKTRALCQLSQLGMILVKKATFSSRTSLQIIPFKLRIRVRVRVTCVLHQGSTYCAKIKKMKSCSPTPIVCEGGAGEVQPPPRKKMLAGRRHGPTSSLQSTFQQH